MPIGKYIYCTNAKLADGSAVTVSQMPIGKYIYCTLYTTIRQDYLKSQMPIGKCIYCTSKWKGWDFSGDYVTNAYRQVHLLYHKGGRFRTFDIPVSQMPIGKYIYCTRHLAPTKWYARSQMPIGKYIYCTCPHNQRTIPGAVVTNAYRQVHLLYLGFLFKKSRHYLQNCRPLQGGLFLGFPSAGETPPQHERWERNWDLL